MRDPVYTIHLTSAEITTLVRALCAQADALTWAAQETAANHLWDRAHELRRLSAKLTKQKDGDDE